MILFRRFVVLQLLLLWQGGFLFYTAFVVPTGTEILGSALAQGGITLRVTNALNVIGVIALAVFAFEMNHGRDLDPRRTAIRWWCWAAMLVCLWLQFYLHLLLVSFMDPTRTQVLVRPWFYPLHRVYLWASTVQWVACVFWASFTLTAWRAEDRSEAPSEAGLQ